MVTGGQHGQEWHRDRGEADAVATDDQRVVDDGVVLHHLCELLCDAAGQRYVISCPAGHRLMRRHVVVAPQPFPQIDVLGELCGRSQDLEGLVNDLRGQVAVSVEHGLDVQPVFADHTGQRSQLLQVHRSGHHGQAA